MKTGCSGYLYFIKIPVSLFCHADLGELHCWVRFGFVFLQFLEEYFYVKAGKNNFDCTL